jgi:hypothetical protein
MASVLFLLGISIAGQERFDSEYFSAYWIIGGIFALLAGFCILFVIEDSLNTFYGYGE